MLADVPVSVRDDLGTGYRLRSRWAAGTGTEWAATWRFEPSVPSNATQGFATQRVPLRETLPKCIDVLLSFCGECFWLGSPVAGESVSYCGLHVNQSVTVLPDGARRLAAI